MQGHATLEEAPPSFFGSSRSRPLPGRRASAQNPSAAPPGSGGSARARTKRPSRRAARGVLPASRAFTSERFGSLGHASTASRDLRHEARPIEGRPPEPRHPPSLPEEPVSRASQAAVSPGGRPGHFTYSGHEQITLQVNMARFLHGTHRGLPSSPLLPAPRSPLCGAWSRSPFAVSSVPRRNSLPPNGS